MKLGHALAISFALTCLSAFGQNVVQNGSFEQFVWQNNSFPPWQAGSGFLNFENAPDGQNFVLIGGALQTVSVEPGKKYSLRFWAAADLYVKPSSTVAVYWNTSLAGTFSTAPRVYDPGVHRTSQVVWEEFGIDDLVATNSQMTLHIVAVDDGQLVLDHVRLTENSDVPTPEPPPENDHFANAQPLGGQSAHGASHVVNATLEPGEPVHHESAGQSVWWTWQAPQTGPAWFGAATDGGPDRPYVSVYTGNSLDSLQRIAGGFDSASIATTRGAVYRIAVSLPSGADAWSYLTVSSSIPWNGEEFDTPVEIIPENILKEPSFEDSGLFGLVHWKWDLVFAGGYVNDPGGADGSTWVTLRSAGEGNFWQDVPTIPGRQYELKFAFRRERRNLFVNLSVQWDGTELGLAHIPESAGEHWHWINFIATATATTSRLNFHNLNGYVDIDALSLVLVPIAPSITEAPAPASVYAGENVTFSASVAGDGPLAFQWHFAGQPIPGETNALLTIPNVSEAHQGSYFLYVSSPYGAASSSPATLTVFSRPVLSPLPNITIFEDSTTNVNFTISDADTPLENLVLSASSSNPDLFHPENISIERTGENCSLTLRPAANQPGSATITIQCEDETGVTSQSFAVEVIAVNDPPEFTIIPNLTIPEDSPSRQIEISLVDLDTPREAINVAVESSNLDLVPASNLSVEKTESSYKLSLRPVADAFGETTLSISISDEQSTVVKTLTVIVEPIDDPLLVLVAGQVTLLEDTSATIPVTLFDVDSPVDEATLEVSSTDEQLLGAGSLSLTGTGADRFLTITPASDLAGSATLTISVVHANSRAIYNVQCSVTPVNDPPFVSALASQTSLEDSPVTIPFTLGDVDSPIETLAVTILSDNPILLGPNPLPPQGEGAERRIILTPRTDQSGSAKVAIIVSDGSQSTTNQFEIIVTPVADPPMLEEIAAQSFTAGEIIPPIMLRISDLDSDIESLAVTATCDNPLLVPDPHFRLIRNGAEISLAIQPAESQTGETIVQVSVSDGASTTTRSFRLEVLAPLVLRLEGSPETDGLTFSWDSQPGGWYQLQGKADLDDPWQDIGAPVETPARASHKQNIAPGTFKKAAAGGQATEFFRIVRIR